MFAHIEASTKHSELINLPEMGVSLFGASLPAYQSLIVNKENEKFLFADYDGNFWNSTKEYNALANLYLAKGKYELFYAQQKGIEKSFADIDEIPITKIVLPVYLAKLKYFGKKLIYQKNFRC